MFAPFSLKFYLNYRVSIEIHGLSSTAAIFKDFQGLEFIFTYTFTDFQGACEL